MVKRCPPGVICIENITIIFIIIVFCLAGLVLYKFGSGVSRIKYENPSQQLETMPKFNSIFSTNSTNTLMNPFVPPLKNSNYFGNPGGNYGGNPGNPIGIPININTRGVDTSYKQVGILTRNVQVQGKEVILGVLGRPLHSNRSKWQYYTMNDKSNSIKLPMSHNGRSCTSEYGCDELMSGDTVYVEGYNDAFKVTIYENSQARYIPF